MRLISAGCKEKTDVSDINLQEPKFLCRKYPLLS